MLFIVFEMNQNKFIDLFCDTIRPRELTMKKAITWPKWVKIIYA